MDFQTLETLQTGHPAWRLLRADLAPLLASFLDRVFLKPNVRQMPESDLVRHLEDDLSDCGVNSARIVFRATLGPISTSGPPTSMAG